MNLFGRIVLVLLGLAILLPGLCFIAFGVWFAGAWITRQPDTYGFTRLAPWQLLIGTGLTVAAIFIFRRIGK